MPRHNYFGMQCLSLFIESICTPMRNKITLKELAKLLNVSVSTVSKALNDSPEISEKTIQRVKELAQLHKYRPNPTAVNLKSSRSGTIAVIVPNINAFHTKVLMGIEREAQRKGLQVITYISDESFEKEKQIIDMISYGFVDGVLIAPSEETQTRREFSHLKEFVAYGVPVVFYDRIDVDFDVDRVGVDDEQSIYEATQMFLDKGLKNVALVSAIEGLDVGRSRIEGYRKAMKDAGLEAIYGVAPSVTDLRSEIGSIVESDMEAIICTDFMSTLLVSRIAHEKEIVIPTDLKLLGYANEDSAPYLYPSLSYIDQHPQEIGRTAIDFLHARINKEVDENESQKKILKTNLVHLESTLFADN